MNVAIVIYSKTGCTFNIARKISSLFTDNKVNCDIIKLNPVGEIRPRLKDVKLQNDVNLDKYDTVIFGTPVWAFTAAPVLPSFFKQSHDLHNKKIITFVTMGLPFKFLGGTSTLTLINKLAASQGANVVNGGIITQFSMHKTGNIEAFAKEIFTKLK